MKISIAQMSLLAVLACSGVSAALPQEELRPLVDAGWAKMMTTRNPRTGVVAGCDTRKSLPPPDATNNLYRMYKGRPGGWGPPGVGDAPLICGTALSGLVDKWNVTHDASVKGEAAKVAQGVLNLAVLHGYKGFVCRGFCSDDKTTVSLSSRDQYTHWIHGLWRYTAAKDLADPAIVAAYRQRVAEVAAFMEERVTEAHEWNFGLADSTEKDYRGICTMWGPEVWPHEAARLPMIYCAAYLATGDAHWRDLYETFIDEALERTLKIKEMAPRQIAGRMPCYSLFQANTSFEPILAYEKNPARVAKIHEAMNAFAHHARLRMKSANPEKPPYGMCWDGELALTQLMAPDLPEVSEVEAFVEAMIRRRDLTKSGVCRAAHVMAAYWRAVAVGKPAFALIGATARGRQLLHEFLGQDLVVTAVADTDAALKADRVQVVNDYYASRPELKVPATICQGRTVSAIFGDASVKGVIVAEDLPARTATAVAALNAGKDVWCEAPIASTPADARTLAEAVGKNVLAVAADHRALAEFRTAAMLVRNGALGKLLNVECRVSDDSRDTARNVDTALWALGDQSGEGLIQGVKTAEWGVRFVGEKGTCAVDVGAFELAGVSFWKEGATECDKSLLAAVGKAIKAHQLKKAPIQLPKTASLVADFVEASRQGRPAVVPVAEALTVVDWLQKLR